MSPELLVREEYLLACIKPAGMPVSSPRKSEATVATWIVAQGWGDDWKVGHRLDQAVSGVVVWARSKEAVDRLSGQFQAKTARVLFDVLVAAAVPLEWGDSFAIEGGLLPHAHRPGTFEVKRRLGLPAVTQVTVRERFREFSFLEVEPLSFRRHQVRAHLAFKELPVVADPDYGDLGQPLLLSRLKRGPYKGRDGEQPLIRDTAVHAREVRCMHPLSGEALVLAAPLPKHFAVGLKYLRKFSGGR